MFARYSGTADKGDSKKRDTMEEENKQKMTHFEVLSLLRREKWLVPMCLPLYSNCKDSLV